MKKLSDRVAIVTGGASGIGEATAKLFVEEGAKVLIADVDEAGGTQLADELGDRAIFLRTDVGNESDIEFAVQTAVEKYGKLDCLFNNAAIPGVSGPIDEIPAQGFDDTIKILFRGVFLGMKHAAGVMKRQGHGTIINMASIAGMRSCNSTHTYSASKAAVIHLTKTAAVELGEKNIRVNAISSGPVLTPFFPRAFKIPVEKQRQAMERLEAIFKKQQPLKDACLPEDVAKAALWLASDDSRFVNGHNLVVDGGATSGIMMQQKLDYFSEISSAFQPFY